MSTVAALLQTADAVWARREATEPAFALGAGRPARGLACVDPERLQADTVFFGQARTCLADLSAADLSPAQDSFRLALMHDLGHRAEAAEFRPLDFVVAPYTGGDLHAEAQQALRAHPLSTDEDREGYLELLRDYARLAREMLTHTATQQARSIRLAAAALPAARTALQGVIQSLPVAVTPGEDRLAALSTAQCQGLLEAVSAAVQRELLPPLHRLLDLLGEDCMRRAPVGVGLHQYPGGEACYRYLVRRHADSALEPQEVHRLGLDALERLRGEKAALRARLMPGMSAEDFDRFVQADARWKAGTPADIEACFVAHVQRAEPLLPQWFGRLPKTPWAVTRADPAFESGMTFGYFQRATPADPVGRYRYNGRDPGGRSLIGAAHLICHELLPGHHLQVSLQDEAPAVHALQRFLMSTATIEGWAVYASSLACEMGVITGFELYGHAQMQSFMAARLVVDTGLNALGWTLEQARAFLREQTIESPSVIDSELLRYATDIPAQALAYEMGHIAIRQWRQDAQQQMGAAFEVRGFHDALLANGGYPLPVLQAQIAHWMATTQEALQ